MLTWNTKMFLPGETATNRRLTIYYKNYTYHIITVTMLTLCHSALEVLPSLRSGSISKAA